MTDLLHSHLDINRILVGCRKIVYDQENKLYDRNFRLSKTSDSYLSLLSINKHLMSNSNTNKVDLHIFRQKIVKSLMPDELQNVNSSIITRHLRWHTKKNILIRERDRVLDRSNNGKLPGRPEIHGENMNNLSGPKSYYSKTEFFLNLQKLVCELVPRAIIYTILRDSIIIERFLKICEYKKLLKIKHTDVNDMIKELKTLRPFPESDFKKDQYKQKQSELLRLKRKKLLMSIASEKAKLLVQELDWNDRIYTKFFIAGGLINYEQIS